MSSFHDHIARTVRGEVLRDVPLAARTSVRVGGTAKLFVRPADVDDLVATLRAAREAGERVHVLGGGANTVIGDGGVDGVVLRLREEDEVIATHGDALMIELSAGAPSVRLVQLAKEHGLLGVEWAAGIPGTVGGMTAMNAGTRVGEMKDNLTEVLLADAEGATWRPASELAFAYRHSELHGKVVAKVRCTLRKGAPEEVAKSLAAMETDRGYRKRSQPLNLPNSGSVFRNPPGDAAGRLIEAAGLKGAVEGGAQISEVHANFIVNRGGASAKDVTTLMARAQKTVWERNAIPLALEVRLVGIFAPSTDILGLMVER